MSVVLDSSATLAWIIPGESTPAILRLFDVLIEGGAIVPSLWWLEVANSLNMAVRRKRIDVDFRNAALADLAQLEIDTDEATAAFAWSETLAIADRFKLTVYDAAYVELASRRNVPLATLDRAMRDAAASMGLTVLGQSVA